MVGKKLMVILLLTAILLAGCVEPDGDGTGGNGTGDNGTSNGGGDSGTGVQGIDIEGQTIAEIENVLKDESIDIKAAKLDEKNINVSYVQPDAEMEEVYATWAYIFGQALDNAPNPETIETVTIYCAFSEGEQMKIIGKTETIRAFFNGEIDTWNFVFALDFEPLTDGPEIWTGEDDDGTDDGDSDTGDGDGDTGEGDAGNGGDGIPGDYYLTGENTKSIVSDEYHITTSKEDHSYKSGEWTTSLTETYATLIRFDIPKLASVEKGMLHLKVITFDNKNLWPDAECDFSKKFHIKKITEDWDFDTADFYIIENRQQSGKIVASFEMDASTEEIVVEIPVSDIMNAYGFTIDQDDDTVACRASFYSQLKGGNQPYITVK